MFRKKVFIAMVTVAFGIIALLSGLWLKGPRITTDVNITELPNGLAAEDEDKYYLVSYNDELERNCLYALDKEDGSYKIISKMDVQWINVDEEKVYYVVQGDSAGQIMSGVEEDGRVGIYAYDKKSGQKTMLTEGMGRCLAVVGNYLYYIRTDDNSYHLYRMKKDGSEKTEFVRKKINSFTVEGNYIYYSSLDDNGVYRIDLNTGYEAKIMDISAGQIQVIGNELLFTNLEGEKLYKSGLKGEKVATLLKENAIHCFYAQEDANKMHIFYVVDSNHSNSPQRDLFCALFKDNKLIKSKKLYSGNIWAINTVGNYVVFYELIETEKDDVEVKALVYKFDGENLCLSEAKLGR